MLIKGKDSVGTDLEALVRKMSNESYQKNGCNCQPPCRTISATATLSESEPFPHQNSSN